MRELKISYRCDVLHMLETVSQNSKTTYSLSSRPVITQCSADLLLPRRNFDVCHLPKII